MFVASCGSTPYGLGDAGVRLDGSASSDGGASIDGGPGLDGGAPSDGGIAADGGGDAGITADGGTPPMDGGAQDGGTAQLGIACTADLGCTSGFCIREAESGWPGGYCTASCRNQPCPSGGVCYSRFSVCLSPCEASCRDGYACSDRLGADVLPRAACVPGRAGARVGDACSNAGHCPAGGYCLTESGDGYPGGYCSLTCQPGNAGSCGDGAVCATFESGGRRQATCLRNCATDTDCRAPGYVCEASWFGITLANKACVPGTRANVAVGASCANAGACPAGWFCLGEANGFPGGYCTRPCGGANQPACPGDAFCQPDFEICLDGCSQDGDCRSPRYACAQRILGASLAQSTCVPHNLSAHVGDGCRLFSDCTLGGYCIPERDESGARTGFDGGYCSASCEGGCATGSLCATLGDFETCVRQCTLNTECRTSDGYVCVQPPSGGDQNACLPPIGG